MNYRPPIEIDEIERARLGLGWLQTFTGKKFYPLDPRPEDICIVDIAHGLSNTCRFSGQVRTFYSVAQHSVLVSQVVPEELALDGLMHDAQEAFIGDMIHPLKIDMPEYRAVEDKIEKVIAKKYGLVNPQPPSVKRGDLIALATERRDLLTQQLPWRQLEEPMAETIKPWSPATAETRFLMRYFELTTKRKMQKTVFKKLFGG